MGVIAIFRIAASAINADSARFSPDLHRHLVLIILSRRMSKDQNWAFREGIGAFPALPNGKMNGIFILPPGHIGFFRCSVDKSVGNAVHRYVIAQRQSLQKRDDLLPCPFRQTPNAR